MFGWMFGVMGFSLAIAASARVGKLEAELKRRRLIDEDYDREPEEGPVSDPRTWSAEKTARVKASRRKMRVAWLKMVLVIGVPIVGVMLVFWYSKLSR